LWLTAVGLCQFQYRTTLQAILELQELVAGIRIQRLAEEGRTERTDEEMVARRPIIIHQIQFLLSPSILKPFFIGHIFNLFQIFTGTLLIIFYAVDMISETQDKATCFDSFTIAQLTAFVRLLFTCVATWLLYSVPRRKHAMAASSVCACAALSLSCFLFVQLKTGNLFSPETHTWITPTLILLFIAANTCAFLPLPSAIMSEILPAKIRGVASGYMYAVNDVMQFFLSKLYPWLKDTLGMHGVFLMFGVNALLCCIFSYLFLPETQGQSLPQIEEYFRNNSLFWVKRDKRSDRCNTTPVYIEMKSTDRTGVVKTYSEQDKNRHTEYTRRSTRKVSVTFSDITEQHLI
jgi:SP family facilitated glucose transporter-like MFS transporter 8